MSAESVRWPARGVVDVWLVPVTPQTEHASRRAISVLSGGERGRADGFVREADRALYVTAHVALRQLVSRYAGDDPAELRFEAPACASCGARHGPPALAATPGLRASLSHTAGLAVVAVATDPVGIDTERCDAGGTDIDALAGYLHPAERLAVAAHPPATRRRAFLRCWVRKEAYLKGRGVGLTEEPDRSNVGLGGDDSPAELTDGWRLTDVAASLTHLVAVALLLPPRDPEPRVRVRTYLVGATEPHGCGGELCAVAQ